MKRAASLLVLLLATPLAFAQDVNLRSEAVHLMEKAHAASTPPRWPNYERTETFRVLDGGAAPEGTLTWVEVLGTGRRVEINFGDFHVVNVLTPGQMATARTRQVPPPEVIAVQKITPIYMVRFDAEDVISTIKDRSVNGQTLRCIEFATTAGQKTQHNELCLDPTNNTLVLEKLGDELVENSEFFLFAGALLPGRILYSFAGQPKIEIYQTLSLVTDAPANLLAAPPDAQILRSCKSWRRPLGDVMQMPQPPPGSGAADFDVTLRGVVGVDGRIQEIVVVTSPRPDVNDEAISILSQWILTPAMCDGHANSVQVGIVLHFHRR